MTLYIGEAAEVTGVTAALSSAIKSLAENLDVVIPALAVIAATLGGRFLAGVVGGTAGLRAFTAQVGIATGSLAGFAATSRLAGLALLGAFGGPVGLAITGITVGLGFLAAESARASAETNRLEAAADANAAAMGVYLNTAEAAAGETSNLTADQVEARASAAGLTIEVDRLADAHYRAAVAARTQAIELQKLALGEAAAEVNDLARGTRRRQRQVRGGTPESRRERRANLAREFLNSEEVLRFSRDRETLRRLQENPIEVEQGGTPSRPTETGRTGRGRTRDNNEAERLERERERLEQERLRTIQRVASEERRLEAEAIRARIVLTDDLEEKLAFERQLLGIERAERIAQIDNEESFTQAQREAMTARINALYGAPATTNADGSLIAPATTGLLEQSLEQSFADERAELERNRIALDQDLLRMRADVLRDEASVASSRQQRLALERQALELEHDIQDSLLRQDIANGEIADADAARAILARQQNIARERLRQDSLSPLEASRERLQASSSRDNVRDSVEGFVVDELEYVRETIAGTIQDAIGYSDPVIDGLLNLIIDQLLIRPLTEALTAVSQGGSIGSGASAAANVISTLFGSIFGGARMSGGNVAGGKAYLVGESGPELFAPAGSGKIYPTGSLARVGGNQTGNSGRPIIQVDARGAVMNDEFARMILARAEQMDERAGKLTYDRALRDAPAAQARAQRYG